MVKSETCREAKTAERNTKKRDLISLLIAKAFRDFEIGSKIFETHDFLGSTGHPNIGTIDRRSKF